MAVSTGAGAEAVFLKSFTLASSDVVTRMSSFAGLLRNMKKMVPEHQVSSLLESTAQ